MKQIWSVKSPLPGVTACRRFTLVELLVTIAIIAILASMLAPALNSARNKARTIQCVSNIRNVNTALISYADSYDGFVPGVMSDDNSPDGTGKKMGWSSLLLYEGHIRNGRELTCTGSGICQPGMLLRPGRLFNDHRESRVFSGKLRKRSLAYGIRRLRNELFRTGRAQFASCPDIPAGTPFRNPSAIPETGGCGYPW